MRKKYELTSETKTLPDGRILYRIRSLVNTQHATAGELGGFIEMESNLSHDDTCWVANEAMVYGSASVIHDALVSDHAIVCEQAVICVGAIISGHAQISGFSRIGGLSLITGRCHLNHLTTADNVRMEALNIVIRKGESDKLFSKSDIDYSFMENNRFNRSLAKDSIINVIRGLSAGIAIGSLLLIFN